MPRRIAVLRPEPGNARTCAALRARGLVPIALPLFVVRACAWTPPDPAAYDALLLTSANAVRHGGTGLDALRTLPVVAVGAATAAAAGAAGLSVALTGSGDAAQAVRLATRYPRLLHLAGRDRIAQPGVDALTVYASEAIDIADADVAATRGHAVLVHSARAAARFAALTRDVRRDTIRLIAISDTVAAAAGRGWQTIAIAAKPCDGAMIDLAARDAIDP